MLVFYQHVLAVRRRLVDILPHRLRWRRAPEGVLVYERGRLSVAVNFRPRRVDISTRGHLLIASDPRVRHRDGKLTLPANSAAWLERVGSP